MYACVFVLLKVSQKCRTSHRIATRVDPLAGLEYVTRSFITGDACRGWYDYHKDALRKMPSVLGKRQLEWQHVASIDAAPVKNIKGDSANITLFALWPINFRMFPSLDTMYPLGNACPKMRIFLNLVTYICVL